MTVEQSIERTNVVLMVWPCVMVVESPRSSALAPNLGEIYVILHHTMKQLDRDALSNPT